MEVTLVLVDLVAAGVCLRRRARGRERPWGGYIFVMKLVCRGRGLIVLLEAGKRNLRTCESFYNVKIIKRWKLYVYITMLIMISYICVDYWSQIPAAGRSLKHPPGKKHFNFASPDWKLNVKFLLRLSGCCESLAWHPLLISWITESGSAPDLRRNGGTGNATWFERLWL